MTIEKKIGLRFSEYELRKVIVALLNNIANRRLYKNMINLIRSVDPKSYEVNVNLAADVFLIRKILITVSNNPNITKEQLLDTIDISGKYSEKAADILANLSEDYISEADLFNIDKKISDELNLALVYNDATDVVNDVNKITSMDYDDLGSSLNTLKSKVSRLDHNFRDNRETVDETKNSLDLSSDGFTAYLDDMIKDMNNPSHRIKTGIQQLNNILDGDGYECSRVYTVCGAPKSGKSRFLLENAIWALKYNHIKPKNKENKPVVLYWTLENSVRETIRRIVNYAKGDEYDMREHTSEDIDEIFKTEHIRPSTVENAENEASLMILYNNNREVSAADMFEKIKELEKDKKEVVFLVVDYLGRMRAVHEDKQGLVRNELGSIVNELHDLAVNLDIPVLTAAQLNRNALSVIDDCTSLSEKAKAIDRLSGSMIGESIQILNNTDVSFAVNTFNDIKTDPEGNIEREDKYFGLSVIGSRVPIRTSMTTFIHPYEHNNGMRVCEDINLPESMSLTVNKLTDNSITDAIKAKGGFVRRA